MDVSTRIFVTKWSLFNIFATWEVREGHSYHIDMSTWQTTLQPTSRSLFGHACSLSLSLFRQSFEECAFCNGRGRLLLRGRSGPRTALTMPCHRMENIYKSYYILEIQVVIHLDIDNIQICSLTTELES